VSSTIGIVAGAGLAAAAYLAYNCYSPTSQLYGATLNHCSDPKHLALTYDDGPNDLYTERLLEILARHEVKATFFLIGRFVAIRPQLARAIADAGHLLGNHTYTHPNLLLLSRRQMRQQYSDCSKAIADATGSHPRFFRPPFGARRPAVLQTARELGLEPVMWDITCFDWRPTTADAVEGHATNRVEKSRTQGHIVLLHDGGHTRLGIDRHHTVEATERLILRYKSDYCFRRIDQI
jgi:peptidoglycan/xylan/chitin deacetylase (PgdA/CDA1 family)